jgi:hypothetical protein
MREMEHPRIAARVHRFGENQSVEFADVRWLADNNPRLIRLAIRSSRNEVFLRGVAEVRQIICRFQLHQRLEECSRSCDFGGRRRQRSNDHRSGWSGRLRSAALATALTGILTGNGYG